MYELSCQSGMTAIAEAAKLQGIAELPLQMPQEMSVHGRAMWTRLRHPKVFETALVLHEIDHLSWWRKRNDLPSTAPNTSPEAIEALEHAISSLLKDQGRGRLCTVETYTRDNVHYFFAYPDDYSETANQHDDNGDLVPIVINKTMQVVFACHSKEGSMETYAKLPKRMKEDLEGCFTGCILNWKLGEHVPGKTFEMNQLKDPHFQLAIDPQDRVAAEVVKMRLAHKTNGRKLDVAIDRTVPGESIHKAIEQTIRTEASPLSQWNVIAVAIHFEFLPKAGRNPPRFDHYDLNANLGGLLRELEAAGVLLTAPPAGSWDCTDCGWHCRLVYLDDVRGISRVYAACSRCGPVAIEPRQLVRFDIDTAALLTAIFESHRVSVEPIDPRGFWTIGRVTWAGQSREVWFVRGSDPEVNAKTESLLATHRQACLFTPTRGAAQMWMKRFPCIVVAMEDVLDWTGDGFQLDEDVVAARLDDGTECTEKPRPRPKRGARAAAIEALRLELNAHILAAADHAFDTSERTGTPELLPKPTQAELAERIGVSPPTLGRCLADKAAPELRILWEAADDVYEVMKWRKLATRRG